MLPLIGISAVPAILTGPTSNMSRVVAATGSMSVIHLTVTALLILVSEPIPWPLAWLCMVHGNFPIFLYQRSSRGTVFYK